VFAGGWALEAAEQVCAGDGVEGPEVLDLLTSLADKSLVLVEQNDRSTRYRLLETVRQYARERLLESGAGEAVRGRHRDYFLRLAEEAAPKLHSAEQAAWLRQLDDEHENLRACLDWSFAEAGSETGPRLCRALFQFWWTRGYLSEGRRCFARVLEAPGSEERTLKRERALKAAGVLAYQQRDYLAARALNEECLSIARELGDRKGVADSLNNLGLVACDQGDFAAARVLYEESLAIKRELGDRPGIANSLNNLGNVAFDQADFVRAQALYQESLSIARELGDQEVSRAARQPGDVAMYQEDSTTARTLHEQALVIKRALGHRQRIASSLISLGNLASRQGDLASARALYIEGLTLVRGLGDKMGVAESLEGLAAVVAALGSPLRAARVWGAAARLRDEFGSPLPPRARDFYERQVAAARDVAGNDAAFDNSWEEGRALTVDAATELALEETVDRR
jgi:non-specific serine/threonine protein kinase